MQQEGKSSRFLNQGWPGVVQMCSDATLKSLQVEFSTLSPKLVRCSSSGRRWAKSAFRAQFGEDKELDHAVDEMVRLLQEQETPDATGHALLFALFFKVLAIYCYNVDAAGHRHGFSLDVPEYLDAIQHFDRCLGRLLDAVAQRDEDWLLAITTDHGGGRHLSFTPIYTCGV